MNIAFFASFTLYHTTHGHQQPASQNIGTLGEPFKHELRVLTHEEEPSCRSTWTCWCPPPPSLRSSTGRDPSIWWAVTASTTSASRMKGMTIVKTRKKVTPRMKAWKLKRLLRRGIKPLIRRRLLSRRVLPRRPVLLRKFLRRKKTRKRPLKMILRRGRLAQMPPRVLRRKPRAKLTVVILFTCKPQIF